MQTQEWLQSLKPGDEVFVISQYGRKCQSRKVHRLTATQIIVRDKDVMGGAYDSRYSKKNGLLIGAGWGAGHIEQPSDVRRKWMEIRQLQGEARALIGKIILPIDKDKLLDLIAAIQPYSV